MASDHLHFFGEQEAESGQPESFQLATESDQPQSYHPGYGQPESGQLGSRQPESNRPGNFQPESGQLGSGHPERNQPEIDQSEGGQLGSGPLEGGQPKSDQARMVTDCGAWVKSGQHSNQQHRNTRQTKKSEVGQHSLVLEVILIPFEW